MEQRFYYKDNNENYYSYKSQHNDLIEITEQEFNEHIAQPQPTAEQIALFNKQKEMAEIKRWLNENDYIINKHILGEYTDDDERWVNYLEQRAEKLARYNELEEQ